MRNSKSNAGLRRRDFVVALGVGSAAFATVSVFPLPLSAATESIDAAIKAVLGDRTAQEGRISLELPQIAENGNTVPLKVEIGSPMTDSDYCKSVHVFAEKNPRPNVASFHFTPACGRAAASSRMRLAKTQNVVAVAEMSDGSVYMAKAEVKVTIGGCGG